MYISNRQKYAKYNIDDFPPNYSGQYTRESLINQAVEPDAGEKSNLHTQYTAGEPQFSEPKEREIKEEKDEKPEKSGTKDGGFLGGLFGGNKDRDKDKDGKKGSLLSGLFKGGDGKDGGFLSGIELEDLILLAVIFFLLKDGFEDDLILIIILGVILISQ